MFKRYYQLAKPGIIYGNLLYATAGFLLASRHRVDIPLLLVTLLGTSLVIASGCVFNNFLDRHIDKKMNRTKKRALVIGTIPVRSALTYATLLGAAGFAVLALYTNWLVVLVGAIGFIDYVVLYGYAKRHSVHSTLVGSISGASPIVAGYCAASGRFDSAAVIVFLMLATWQMAHFYGIAMYRHDDYKAAGLPVLPVLKGMQVAKNQTLAYIVAFIAVSCLLTVYGYTGWVYLLVMLPLGIVWLVKGLRTYKDKDNRLWGRKMFLFSLIVTLVTTAMLAAGPHLP